MPVSTNRADLLGAEWTNLYLVALTLALGALWVAAHRFKPNSADSRVAIAPLAWFALRGSLATATLWAVFQLLARGIFLATPWPLWVAAAIGGAAIELAVTLYQHERRIAGGNRSKLIVSLRIAALFTITVILLQPVLAHESKRRLQREIVILLDDSASMQLADRQLTASEKLKIAALFGVGAAQRGATLTEVHRTLLLLDRQLAAEARALEPPAGVSAAAANSLISGRVTPLGALFESARARCLDLVRITKRARRDLSGPESRPLEDIEDRIAQNIDRGLAEAGRKLAEANYSATAAEIQNINRQISYVLEVLPPIIEASDQKFYASLSTSDREIIDAAAATTRSAIARQSLRRGDLVEDLNADYRLRFIRFGRSPQEIDGPGWLETGRPAPVSEDQSDFRRATDLTAALEAVTERVPTADLAGILLLSDGRHNGARPVEDVARRLGIARAPVCSVVIGSSAGPRDACVIDVRVPDAIYLDDRAIIYADLKLDGLAGQTVPVSLLKDGELIEARDLEISADRLRTTVRFAHTPDKIGISEYTLNLGFTPGETFVENNRWKFEVAVTDDRTNVLLIESFPRWEFRYLRNLFHARDKSVHLQSVLLNPDEIADTPPAATIVASADRKFGESEATALPTSRSEWLKFDAIILGDIPPGAIDETTWSHIEHCVAERAALLITIAGPRHMPHAFSSQTLKRLLPVTYEQAPPGADDSKQNLPYRLRLTPEGRNSLIMLQSPDPNLNDLVWGSLPPLHWRHAITGIKPGAEVLAYAQPIGAGDRRSPTRKLQTTNALIATQRYALGKVVSLNFDRTWRLRYGVGDVHHHKFWGQILRWGTGENLRAGNQLVRLGTDKLAYEPGDGIRVTARVTRTGNRPLTRGEVTAAVYRDGDLVARSPLSFRQDSNGIFEAELPPPPGQGRFVIRLEGQDVVKILEGQSLPPVETEFLVEARRNAVELSELTADPRFLGQLAALSGGSIADPDNASALRKFFSPPGQIVRERTETSLWDNFPLLIFFLALLTTEWLNRRKAGLT